MTKNEAFHLLCLIEKVYPYCLVKDETVLTWFQHCSDIDFEEVLVKFQHHIRSNPYPPSMDELLFSKEASYSWFKEYSPRKRVNFL